MLKSPKLQITIIKDRKTTLFALMTPPLMNIKNLSNWKTPNIETLLPKVILTTFAIKSNPALDPIIFHFLDSKKKLNNY